jgi:hypothetical protein
MSSGHHLAAAQRLGHVARDDALGQTLDDGGLAHAGLADEHGIVLGAARQNLDDAAHFFGAADDGIELALERRFGEITRVLRESLVPVLGVRIVRLLGATNLLQDGRELVAGDPATLEQFGAPRIERGEGEEKVLGGDVLILQLPRFLDRRFEKSIDAGREHRLPARLFRQAVEDSIDVDRELLRVDTESLESRRDHAALLVEGCLQDVLRRDLSMVRAFGERLSCGDDFLGTNSELILSHRILLKFSGRILLI